MLERGCDRGHASGNTQLFIDVQQMCLNGGNTDMQALSSKPVRAMGMPISYLYKLSKFSTIDHSAVLTLGGRLSDSVAQTEREDSVCFRNRPREQQIPANKPFPLILACVKHATASIDSNLM
jgi:hypothetical protein